MNKIQAKIKRALYSNPYINSLQNNSYEAVHSSTYDELSNILLRIITDLTKADSRFMELPSDISMDPNRMTIAQRTDYDKHKKEQVLVFKQIQKEY